MPTWSPDRRASLPAAFASLHSVSITPEKGGQGQGFAVKGRGVGRRHTKPLGKHFFKLVVILGGHVAGRVCICGLRPIYRLGLRIAACLWAGIKGWLRRNLKRGMLAAAILGALVRGTELPFPLTPAESPRHDTNDSDVTYRGFYGFISFERHTHFKIDLGQETIVDVLDACYYTTRKLDHLVEGCVTGPQDYDLYFGIYIAYNNNSFACQDCVTLELPDNMSFDQLQTNRGFNASKGVLVRPVPPNSTRLGHDAVDVEYTADKTVGYLHGHHLLPGKLEDLADDLCKIACTRDPQVSQYV